MWHKYKTEYKTFYCKKQQLNIDILLRQVMFISRAQSYVAVNWQDLVDPKKSQALRFSYSFIISTAIVKFIFRLVTWYEVMTLEECDSWNHVEQFSQ